MSRNGDNRRKEARLTFELAMELCIIHDARHTPVRSQRKALAWLRRWKRKPGRVFWEIQPTGGQRLL